MSHYTYEDKCLYCGRTIELESDSAEARYGLEVFCPDMDCEDRYAWFEEPYKPTHKDYAEEARKL